MPNLDLGDSSTIEPNKNPGLDISNLDQSGIGK